jgi:hypothetical protein
MRTVLSGICLFIDNSKLSDSIFISDRDRGEESRIAERHRERECVCVWEREREAVHSGKGEVALVIKWAIREINVVKNVGLISKILAWGQWYQSHGQCPFYLHMCQRHFIRWKVAHLSNKLQAFLYIMQNGPNLGQLL